MAVRISRLAILLGVDQKGLSTGIKAAEAKVKSFGSFVSSTLSNAFGFAGGAAIVRGVNTVTSALTGQFSEINRLAKTSDRLGVAIPTLQTLGRAAQIAGTDFEDLADALKDTQVRISEAARGDGILEVFRDDLKLDPKELLNLSAIEQFEVVRSAIEGIQNQAQRVRVADELFGDVGVRTLTVSADTIRRAREEMEQFGFAISDFNASKVEAANGAFGRLALATDAIIQRLTVAVAPAIQAIVDLVARNVAALGDGFFSSLSRDIALAADVLASFLSQLGGSVLFGKSGEFDAFTSVVTFLVDSVKSIASILIDAAILISRTTTQLQVTASQVGIGSVENAAKELLANGRRVANLESLRERISSSASGADLLNEAEGRAAGRRFIESWTGGARDVAPVISEVIQEAANRPLLSLADSIQTQLQFAANQAGVSAEKAGLSGAVKAGSVEAASLRLSAFDAATKTAEAQLREQQAATQILSQIAANTATGVLGIASIP